MLDTPGSSPLLIPTPDELAMLAALRQDNALLRNQALQACIHGVNRALIGTQWEKSIDSIRDFLLQGYFPPEQSILLYGIDFLKLTERTKNCLTG
jgi:hypothetical protein